MGPGPIPQKGSESPVATKTISGKKSGPAIAGPAGPPPNALCLTTQFETNGVILQYGSTVCHVGLCTTIHSKYGSFFL